MTEQITGKQFSPSDTVIMDGQEFSDCEFNGAKVVFEGGELPSFHNCHFNGVVWHLDGAADRTLVWLRFLVTTGNHALVESIIKSLRGDSTLS